MKKKRVETDDTRDIVASQFIRKIEAPEDRVDPRNIQSSFIRRDRSLEPLSFLVLMDSADLDCAKCEKDTVHHLQVQGGGIWAARESDQWECLTCQTLTPYIATRPR